MKTSSTLFVWFAAAFAAFAAPPHAVNRAGERPVLVITAPDPCAWPNLELLNDGLTLIRGDRNSRMKQMLSTDADHTCPPSREMSAMYIGVARVK